MGWAHGIDRHGREVGYGVTAICDHIDCDQVIDRGLAYVCGGEPDGGEDGCGVHFCGHHLFYAWRGEDEHEMSPQLCAPCLERWENAESEVAA